MQKHLQISLFLFNLTIAIKFKITFIFKINFISFQSIWTFF